MAYSEAGKDGQDFGERQDSLWGRRVKQRRILQPDAEEEVELETDMVTSHTAELRLE